jgi:hypothetical protein
MAASGSPAREETKVTTDSPTHDDPEIAQQVEELSARIGEKGLSAAYDALEQAFADFAKQTGEDPEVLSAPGATPLSFHVPGANRAREFLRKNLCEGPPALRTAVEAAIPSGAGAVVHAVIVVMALPAAAIAIAPIIAAVVMTVGLKEACRSMAVSQEK